MWILENNLMEPSLSFHHLGPRDLTQVIWFGSGKHVHPLNHLHCGFAAVVCFDRILVALEILV